MSQNDRPEAFRAGYDAGYEEGLRDSMRLFREAYKGQSGCRPKSPQNPFFYAALLVERELQRLGEKIRD